MSVKALWIAISGTPNPANIDQYAGRYSVIILNSWARAARDQIRRVNPNAMLFVYQCLSSTRNYAGAVVNGQDVPDLPTGVGYIEAQTDHPEWFAHDAAGNRIEWAPKYPGSWQMAVWDTGYQQRWIANVSERVAADGWDGVFGDNDLSKLQGYSAALFAGTTTAAQTNAQLTAGLDAMISAAGSGLPCSLTPNISEGRLNLPRWNLNSRCGGGMDEAFAHWGTVPTTGFCTSDFPKGGWEVQTAELKSPLTLLVTRAAASDLVSQHYGYCSALVQAVGPVAWMPSTGPYSTPEWTDLQNNNVGSPVGPSVKLANGVWVREFTEAWVAVNPTVNPQTVTVPAGFVVSGSQSIPMHDSLFTMKLP